MPLLTLKNTPLHPLTLSFPRELEHGFQEDYFDKSLKQVRIVHILAILLYALFGFLDEHITPEVKHIIWFIRYAIFCPVALLLFMVTYLPIYKRIMQVCMSCLFFLPAAGVIAAMYIRKPYDDHFPYYPGLMLIITICCTCCNLRFIYAFLTASSIMAMYLVIALFLDYSPFEFWSSNTQLFSSCIMASFASYQIELRNRKNYLQQQIIDEERKTIEKMKYAQEKEKIIKNLHDGIGGIITNINLLSEMAAATPGLKNPQAALASIAELSRECLSEIRTFIDVLDVEEKTWQTLCADMRRLGKNMLEGHGISLTFDVSGDGSLQPEALVAINLMRIYKEALTNVIKHSRAESVRVNMDISRQSIVLSVKDNGTWQGNSVNSGRGLVNMRARARDMSGALTITHDNGTEVLLKIPSPEQGEGLPCS